MSSQTQYMSTNSKNYKKTMTLTKKQKVNNGSGVLLLLLLFLVLTISFVVAFLVIPNTLAAQVTMEVYQQADGKAFGKETSLDIFNNDNHYLDGENLVAPFSYGSYTFAVYNSASSASLPYSLLFEATNEEDIPIVISIQKNGTCIFGGESDDEMLPLSVFDLKDLSIGGKKTDFYTLKWRWNTESDASDTALGVRAANGEELIYSLKITATGTISEASLSNNNGNSGIKDMINGIINKLPKTGDDNSILLWTALIFAAFSLMLIVLIVKRRKKKDDESMEEIGEETSQEIAKRKKNE